MAPIILCDVNETLIDLSPLRPEFTERFAGAIDVDHWFSELLRLSFVYAATEQYAPFTQLAGHALTTIGDRSGIGVAAEDITYIGGRLRELPAHEDARRGLETLDNAGALLVAITNSPPDVANAQLTNAGLADTFTKILSVDGIQRFKPHPAVYRYAAAEMGADPGDCTMIAAHDWDIAGAMHTGSTGVFIDRGDQSWSPAFGLPDHVASGIDTAAEWIIRQ